MHFKLHVCANIVRATRSIIDASASDLRGARVIAFITMAPEADAASDKNQLSRTIGARSFRREIFAPNTDAFSQSRRFRLCALAKEFIKIASL
jgi:hypothetical protein